MIDVDSPRSTHDAVHLAFYEAPYANLILRADKHIEAMNLRAELLMARGAVFRVVDNVLVMHDKNRAADFERMLTEATRRPRVFVFATAGGPNLVASVRRLPNGNYVSLSLRGAHPPTLSRWSPIARHYGLTFGEVRVLRLLLQGLSITDAASQLRIATVTGRTHVKSIYNKIGVKNREQLLAFALSFSFPGV